MGSGRIISVNSGKVAELAIGGKPAWTAIGKWPVAGPVAAGPLGLAGDETGDTTSHGPSPALTAGPRARRDR
jgi:MOSC domain-containing protein YiiM